MQSKPRGTQRKGRYSAVKSSQLSWAGQYKKCVQYDLKFTSEYSVTHCRSATFNIILIIYSGEVGSALSINNKYCGPVVGRLKDLWSSVLSAKI